MKIILTSNTAWYLWNFRRGLIKALIQAGGEIYTLCPEDKTSSNLGTLGCKTLSVPIHSKGVNPIEEILLFLRFLKIIRNIGPHIILAFTIKPVIYAGIVARVLGLPIVHTITGLGTIFINPTWVTWFAINLYKLALRKAEKVFFQNDEDRNIFQNKGIISPACSETVPGSGINLQSFSFSAISQNRKQGEEVFLFVGRLLRDKGILEFVEAARLVKLAQPEVKFQILGPLGLDNQTAIQHSEVERWVSSGVIEYVGETDDVRPYIENCDCLVLPSYREGLPRVLLEASAIGRPVIATNVAGCRDVVEDKVTGLLCQVRDAEDLADKINQFICLSVTARHKMGSAGHKRVKHKFDEHNVIERYVSTVVELVTELKSKKVG